MPKQLSNHYQFDTSIFSLRVWGWCRETGLSPPVQYFTDRSKAVLFCGSLMFFSVLCLLCLCARLFICALWSSAGKGWPLGSRLWYLTVSLSLSHCYPGSGVVLDCIDSWSLHPGSIIIISFQFCNQAVENLIGRHIPLHLFWVCTACICPIGSYAKTRWRFHCCLCSFCCWRCDCCCVCVFKIKKSIYLCSFSVFLFQHFSNFSKIWCHFPTSLDLAASWHSMTFTLLLDILKYSL